MPESADSKRIARVLHFQLQARSVAAERVILKEGAPVEEVEARLRIEDIVSIPQHLDSREESTRALGRTPKRELAADTLEGKLLQEGIEGFRDIGGEVAMGARG
jgi:hypothetical protein